MLAVVFGALWSTIEPGRVVVVFKDGVVLVAFAADCVLCTLVAFATSWYRLMA